MKLSSNMMRFYHEWGIRKTIDVFSEAGLEAIEFNTDLEEYYRDSHDEAFYRELRDYAKEKGISFWQAHAPYETSFAEEEKNKQRFRDIVTSMRHASWLGVQRMVVHPARHLPCNEPAQHEIMMAYNRNFYQSLIPYAEEFGMKIAIENIMYSVTQTAEGLLALIHGLDNEVFTVCCDIGHAHIAGQDAAEMIRTLGRHITCTHVHDNDGKQDLHTLPYHGTIDWESVMQALAESGYEGNLNYEAGPFVKNLPGPLKADAAQYMACVGRHLIARFWHYKRESTSVKHGQ